MSAAPEIPSKPSWKKFAIPMTSGAAKRSAEHGNPVYVARRHVGAGHGTASRPRLVHQLTRPAQKLAWKRWHPGYKYDYKPGMKPVTDDWLFTHESYGNKKNGQVPFDYWHKQGHAPGERLLYAGKEQKKSGSKKKSAWLLRNKKVTKVRVQSFGKKKTCTAVAFIRNGRGAIKINGQPIKLVRPEMLRYKIYEPILVVGERRFRSINMRVRVSGGGQTSQVYAIRQAMAKALVAYYAKYKDAASALELKKLYTAYDRSLLIADPRRMEAKKFGGRGARARRQKSYR